MWPVGASPAETDGIAVTSAAVGSPCKVGSKKSNAEVDVGVIGAGEKAETGVEADSVANKSMVGSVAGADRRVPTHKVLTRNKKPQNKISPTAMIRVRVFFVIPLFYPRITVISSASTF